MLLYQIIQVRHISFLSLLILISIGFIVSFFIQIDNLLLKKLIAQYLLEELPRLIRLSNGNRRIWLILRQIYDQAFEQYHRLQMTIQLRLKLEQNKIECRQIY